MLEKKWIQLVSFRRKEHEKISRLSGLTNQLGEILRDHRVVMQRVNGNIENYSTLLDP